MRAPSTRPRVGIVGVWHETNTYALTVTTRADFAALEWLEGDSVIACHANIRSVIGGFLANCTFEPVGILSVGAWPSGPADRGTAGAILDGIASNLSRAGHLDGILCNLHGAMVVEGDDDFDTTLLREVRQSVGSVPVSVVVDMHANPSVEFADVADAICGYRTYPHVDQGTTDEPMRSILDVAESSRCLTGARSVSVLPGFAYSDVGRAGTSVLAVTEKSRRETGERLVQEIASLIESRAGEFSVSADTPEAAVDRAVRARVGPVVLVDVADNTGGGSPGDGTALLRELIRRNGAKALVFIADRAAVAHAQRIGGGKPFVFPVGGKTDNRHGGPVDVVGSVRSVQHGHYVSSVSYLDGQEVDMGLVAIVEAGSTTIVLTSRAVPPFHRECVTSLGLSPEGFDVIVAKGAIAWISAFGDIAAEANVVDGPGICPLDPRRLERATVPDRH